MYIHRLNDVITDINQRPIAVSDAIVESFVSQVLSPCIYIHIYYIILYYIHIIYTYIYTYILYIYIY